MRWPDSADAIFAGDQAIALAYLTPAHGVVLAPVTNFAVRDRRAGTLTVNSSVGAWRKLERIRRDPHVALAYHTREHGLSARPEYVLVQGTATLSAPDPHYPAKLGQEWERSAGPLATGPLWDRWLRVYHTRVAITVAVQRVIVWPDLGCRGTAEVYGAPLPAEPARPQRPPGGGTAPRVSPRRAAATAARLPHVLLGWAGTDGLPVVVPVQIGRAQNGAGGNARGITLDVPPGLVPDGGRRAGLTAHSFTRYVIGQHQRLHTGWLEAGAGGRDVRYAPHTLRGHHLPPSRLVYNLAVGFGTRRWLRAGQRTAQARTNAPTEAPGGPISVKAAPESDSADGEARPGRVSIRSVPDNGRSPRRW